MPDLVFMRPVPRLTPGRTRQHFRHGAALALGHTWPGPIVSTNLGANERPALGNQAVACQSRTHCGTRYHVRLRTPRVVSASL